MMADILESVRGVFNKRRKDMGDGTHAEVIYIGGGTVAVADELSIGEIALPVVGVVGQESVDNHGTPQPLSAVAVPLVSGVTIRPLPGNTGTVYLGFSDDVDETHCYPLEADDSPVFVETDDLSNLWIDSSADDDGVAWIGG